MVGALSRSSITGAPSSISWSPIRLAVRNSSRKNSMAYGRRSRNAGGTAASNTPASSCGGTLLDARRGSAPTVLRDTAPGGAITGTGIGTGAG
ncbi:MAG TPA: hypothetical protein VHN14_02300, partial [Kofleriaceae bacterium]|nr:hypothetical protein [Kofleriaceae bacterium]